MYVSVGFYDETLKCFKTKGYTYETDLKLQPWDVVKAPVKNRGTGEVENKRAVVLNTNLEQPKFPCSVIKELWEDEDNG